MPLKNLAPPYVCLVLSGIVVMLGVIDWASGHELHFFVFYFLPAAMAGWYCNHKTVTGISLFCALTWLASDYWGGTPYSHRAIEIWNTVIRLIAFLSIGYSLNRIRDLLREQEKISRELQHTLNEVKTLKGLIPICASCKQIRNDQGYWQQLEEYIQNHSEAQFTHGICQKCAAKVLEEAGIRFDPHALTRE